MSSSLPTSPLKYLFFMTMGAGNQPMAIAVAQKLRASGHTVIFVCYQAVKPLFTAFDFETVVYPKSSPVWDAAVPTVETFLELQLCNPSYLEDVPQLILQHQPDRVIIDAICFGGLAAGEKNLIPSSTPVIIYSHCTYSGFRACESMGMAALKAMRDRLGLAPVDTFMEPSRLSGATSGFITGIPEMEPHPEILNEDKWRGFFHYVGPQIPQYPPSQVTLPWPGDDKRPLILCSFSTGVVPQRTRIDRCVAAFNNVPAYRMLCTYSQTSVDDLLATLPENICLIKSIPHPEIIHLVSCIVTHAGHGTINLALTYGVPLVCLPCYGDQFPNSQQIAKLGVGITLDGEKASPDEIRGAVELILTEPKYRLAIHELQKISQSYADSPIE